MLAEVLLNSVVPLLATHLKHSDTIKNQVKALVQLYDIDSLWRIFHVTGEGGMRHSDKRSELNL